MEELVKLVVEKAGVSADVAKRAVEGILSFLKGKLPAAAVGQLDSALGGSVAKLASSSDSLTDLVTKSGLPADKVHGVLETVFTQLKGKLPESVLGQLQGLLQGEGAAHGGIFGKIAGWFGMK